MGLGITEISGPAEAASERVRLSAAVLKTAADAVPVGGLTVRTLAGNLALITFQYNRFDDVVTDTEELILPMPCRAICAFDTALDSVTNLSVTWKFRRGTTGGTGTTIVKTTRSAISVAVGSGVIGGVTAVADGHMLLLPGDRIFATISAQAKGIAAMLVLLT